MPTTRAPRPQATLLGPEQPVGATHAWYALRDEIMDRVDEVSDAGGRTDRKVASIDDRVSHVQSQLQQLEASQGSSLADVRSLLTSTTSLDARFSSFEGSLRALAEAVSATPGPVSMEKVEKRIIRVAEQRAVEQARREQDVLVDSVRDLLANFRAEIVTTLREVDKRCTTIEGDVKDVRHVAERAREDAAALKGELASFRRELEELNERHSAHVTEATNQASMAHKHSVELGKRYEDLVDAFESFDERAGELQALVDSDRSDFAARMKTVESQGAATSALRDSISGLESLVNDRVATVVEDVDKLRQDMESRHRSVVSSTHQALAQLAESGTELPGIVTGLQHDVASLRETANVHDSAIERWRVDGSALAELRDWLQDLERRSASKSDLDQLNATVTSQLATLRDASHNAEHVLAQKLEAERSAREFESTALRSQMQRVQANTSGRLASP